MHIPYHKVERKQVVDSQALEHQHYVTHVRPEYFRRRVRVELVLEGVRREQPEALARLCPACSSRPLVRRRLTDRHDHERLHPRLGAEVCLLVKSRVDHVLDSVDRKTSLGDVSCEHHLPCVAGSLFEDLGLLLAREIGVDWAKYQLGHLVPEHLGPLRQDLVRRLDLLLPREEDQYIPVQRLRYVYLQHRHDRRVDIIGLRTLRVVNVDGEHPPRDHEDGRVVEVLAKFLRVEGGTTDDQLEVVAEAGHVLDEAEEYVCVQRALVGLVRRRNR